MRLCVHEGRFLIDVYDALNERMTWEECDRVRTCISVIEDERADFNAWHSKNYERVIKLRARKNASAEQRENEGEELSIDDLKRELDDNRQGAANAQADLRKHREALAHGRGAEHGLLDPSTAEFVQQVADIHADKVAMLEQVIADRFAPEDASLSNA